MKLFKRKKRLEELDDCPYIKTCGFKDSSILSYCGKGGYTDCSIYQSNEESKTKEEGEEK